MKARYPSVTSIKAWQTTSPAYEHFTRLARVIYSTLYFIQLPFIGLDYLLGTTFYGRPSWSFKYRSLTRLLSYMIWSQNPATRPISDVLSYDARKNPDKLAKGRNASLIEVKPRPDKLFGDALHPDIVPELCPCFWQWSSSMPSPLSDSAPPVERKVIYYVVGGGMVQGHPCSFTDLPWSIIEITGVPIFGVNFRKCVVAKSAFPAALQDVVAGYFYLLDEGFSPENICVMGDSGGGCIAITLLLYLRRHGLTMPGSSVLISPFVDLVDDFLGNKELLNLDILNPEMLGMVQYQYTENRPDLRGSLLSPARDELPVGYTFEGFPRTLVNYGDAEVFTPSILKFVELLRKAGVMVEVVVGKDEVHDYPIWTKRSEFHDRLKTFLDRQGSY
jgi:monoterpene epsilon-lactone hydrolase